MTDLEMTKLCADAMGYEVFGGHVAWVVAKPEAERGKYDPLRNDAQAMALVKKFGLRIDEAPEGRGAEVWEVVKWDWRSNEDEVRAKNGDLNRAIVECVAKIQAAK